MSTRSIADDTRWLDATAQAELIASGDLKPSELTEAAIERIEELDGALNSVVIRWFDHARDLASGPLPDGPFKGVPFLLKNLWAPYEGQTMSNGNSALKAEKPIDDADSTLVSRFRNCGFVTLGRTASPELGSLPVTEPLAYEPTRNPWDTSRTPGGSSGGAAAAVAAGMVPIAHASDGGGSIRIPASCCGLVGLKPTQGRISKGPFLTESNLSVELAVTRTVRDTARVLDAVAGPAVGDTVIAAPPVRPYASEVGADPGQLRIGLLDHHPQGGAIHEDCVAAVRSAATQLEALGHSVAADYPASLSDSSFTPRFMALWAANMASGIRSLGATIGRDLTAAEVEPVNWALAEHAHQLSAVDHAAAIQATADFRRATHQWWQDGWDLLLTPTLGEPPLAIGECDSQPGDPMAGMRRATAFVPFTPPFNTSGQPAISLPLFWNSDGLPIGVQLVAAYGREDLLIRVASQLEAAYPWADRIPT